MICWYQWRIRWHIDINQFMTCDILHFESLMCSERLMCCVKRNQWLKEIQDTFTGYKDIARKIGCRILSSINLKTDDDFGDQSNRFSLIFWCNFRLLDTKRFIFIDLYWNCIQKFSTIELPSSCSEAEKRKSGKSKKLNINNQSNVLRY